MRIRPLCGMMIVTRDADETMYGMLYLPDVEHKRAQSGIVHLHAESDWWDEDRLTGKRILFTKYSDRELKIGDKYFVIVDERDVLAVFTRSTPMKKATFLEEINKQLGTIEGDDLSGNDLTQISEDVAAWAEDEIGLEDDEEGDDEAEEKE